MGENMKIVLAFAVLVTIVGLGCNDDTEIQRVLESENRIDELTSKVEQLEAEVLMLTAEVSPRFVGVSAATTLNPAPFVGLYLQPEIAETRETPASFWTDRLDRARAGLMGGSPTYEEVLAEKEYYEDWLDYTSWLKQNSDGFTRVSWQVGDEYLSRLDYIQLQLKWLRERP